jgi:hypothetical protein
MKASYGLVLISALAATWAMACPDVRCDVCVPPGQHTCRIIDCFGEITNTFVENCDVSPPPYDPGSGSTEPGKIYACPFYCSAVCGESRTGADKIAYGATYERARESVLSQCSGTHYNDGVLCNFQATMDLCYTTHP